MLSHSFTTKRADGTVSETQWDIQKQLRWEDVTIKNEFHEGQKIEILSLRLRLPKTDRTLPNQIVELPETGLKRVESRG